MGEFDIDRVKAIAANMAAVAPNATLAVAVTNATEAAQAAEIKSIYPSLKIKIFENVATTVILAAMLKSVASAGRLELVTQLRVGDKPVAADDIDAAYLGAVPLANGRIVLVGEESEIKGTVQLTILSIIQAAQQALRAIGQSA